MGANMRLCKNWKPVIEAFQARLSKWGARTLSIGVIRPKQNGGLGVGSLNAANLALLAKRSHIYMNLTEKHNTGFNLQPDNPLTKYLTTLKALINVQPSNASTNLDKSHPEFLSTTRLNNNQTTKTKHFSSCFNSNQNP
ncbi:hypothetical protein QVD17_21116 [Tagetes erecta]|uniref:Uncharacterized protein n=1 Tax=Tagetes erecta TaxID=13708 RepID=A0AAD8KMY0_TARER|nr:hypothetical protein QVD17_21116 [Tagetes erecta]